MMKFQCPEGLLLGRNFSTCDSLPTLKVFQCPEGLLLGRNCTQAIRFCLVAKFQCPEGLLLGRNPRKRRYTSCPMRSFSAPKGCCLVATALSAARCPARFGFSAPKGCCLVATVRGYAGCGIQVVSVPRRAVAWSQLDRAVVGAGYATMFQCPEGLLLGRNNVHAGRGRHCGMGFQCPEGLLLGRNPPDRARNTKLCAFQCPEGLLLGRNNKRHIDWNGTDRVSVPRRAVAWSQPACKQAAHRRQKFQCPEGLLLGRNLRPATRPRIGITVSVPRRAVAWSQRERSCQMCVPNCCFSAPKGCCLVATARVACEFQRVVGFSAPKGCCLVATTRRPRVGHSDSGFQCPEGLLLGRNLARPAKHTRRLESFSAPKGCCLVATDLLTQSAYHPKQVSVPRRAVAWSQPDSRGGNMGLGSVSVPRRAVAWSQPGRFPHYPRRRLERFSAPKGCCLVATRGYQDRPALA